MKQFFDFKLNQEIIPVKGLKEFFIHPLSNMSAIMLSLEEKVTKKTPIKWGFCGAMPVLIFPLDILDLGECTIEYLDMNHGTIYFKDYMISFSVTKDRFLMINSAGLLIHA